MPPLVPPPSPSPQAQHPASPALKRLLRALRPHRRRVWQASLCSVLNKIFDLAPPVLIGLAVDVVVRQQTSSLASLCFRSVPSQLALLALLSFVIWSAESGFEYLYGVLWRNLAQTVQHELRLEAYGHLQQLEMAFFESSSSGRLMAILNDDINQLERFLDGGANDILQVSTTAVTVSAVFLYMTPQVAVLAMLPIPAIIWGSVYFQRKIAPRYAEVRERVGTLNGILSNNLDGIATIKSFVTERDEVARVDRASERYRLANRGAIGVSASFSPLIRMVILAGFTATLLVGGFQVFDGTLAVAPTACWSSSPSACSGP